jgi:hypothetical protein
MAGGGRGFAPRRVLGFAAGLVVGVACAQRPAPLVIAPTPTPAPPSRAVCGIETSYGLEHPRAERVFPAAYYFTLLLKGYHWGTVPRPITECSGRPVVLKTDGCGKEPPPPGAPIDRLTERDVYVIDATDTTRLVWVMVERFRNGEAQGPVALVEITDRGLAVRALGVLRAFTEHVALRLVPLGTGSVLVAETEHCAADSAQGQGCKRAIRFMPRSGERFVSASLGDEKGVCVGSAFIELTASGLSPATSEKFGLETAVSFGPEEITLREQLTISPPGTSAASARAAGFVREVRAERRIRLKGEALIVSGPDLVTRWLSRSNEIGDLHGAER